MVLMAQHLNPRDLLAEPRKLLRRFEAQMEYPEGLAHLSEGLSLLADIAAGTTSAELKQTCSTMVSTYALQVQARAQPLLTQSSVQKETLAHWHSVFSEFEGSGFALPSQVTKCSANLLCKQAFGETFDEMSPSRLEEISKLMEDHQAKLLRDKHGKPAGETLPRQEEA
jgi:hypothetical protein